MTYQEAVIKAENNKNMINSKYILETGETVMVTSVYPNELGHGWEVYARILPIGFPENDSVQIADNIDNFVNYTKV